MVICVCSNLNEEKIREVVKHHCNKKLSVFEIHDKLECNVGCGKCLEMINEIIKENEC